MRTFAKITKILSTWIAIPICQELPFFCLMVILMFFSHFLWEVSDNALPMSIMQWRNIGIALSISVFMAWGLAVILWYRPNKAVKSLLYAISLLLMFIDLFLFFNFSTLLSPWVLLLIKETNGGESSEFVNHYLLTKGSIRSFECLLLFCLAAFFWEKKWRCIKCTQRLEHVIAIIATPFLILGAYLFWQSTRLVTMQTQYDFEIWQEGHGHYAKQNTPINLLYSIRYLHLSGQDNEKAIHVCQAASCQPAFCTEHDSLTVVLVIGESFNKWHTPLYGYYLNTTPQLCTLRDRGNLFVFQDVVAPYNMTTFSVKNILSTNSIADNEPWYAKPSFPIIFKKAGFHVSMWDNQRPTDTEVSSYDYALGSYMYAREILPISYCEYNTRTYEYDLSLTQTCKQHLEKQQSQGHCHRLSLYIFHLMGQHSYAAWRFPPSKELQVFKSSDIMHDDLDESEKQIIADYDNATHYNDLVIGSIVDMFKDKPSLMIYLSDHGEEVYDYRHFLGRTHERKKSRENLRYQYEIPFVLWCSDRYINAHPQQIEAIHQALNKPATSDDVAHMLFSLAAIQTSYYQERRDLLSPNYNVGKRILQGFIDYDNLN